VPALKKIIIILLKSQLGTDSKMHKINSKQNIQQMASLIMGCRQRLPFHSKLISVCLKTLPDLNVGCIKGCRE
jgi:hypothetical protein